MRNEPQQSRSRDKLEKVLVAADREFGENGYHRAQMTAIATRAEVSVGALYRLFADKTSIAEALANRYLHDSTEVFAPIVEKIGKETEADEICRMFVRASVELHRQHPGYLALAVETARSPDDASQPVRTATIDFLEAHLDSVGRLVGNPRRRRAIEMIFEVVRHFLFIGPAEGTTLEQHVDEVEALTIAYISDVFDESSSSAGSSAQ